MHFRRRPLPHHQLDPGPIVDVLLEIERKRQERRPGPMVTALAVDAATRLPDPRWFDLARELGRLQPGEDEVAFWKKEIRELQAKYNKPPRRTNNGG